MLPRGRWDGGPNPPWVRPHGLHCSEAILGLTEFPEAMWRLPAADSTILATAAAPLDPTGRHCTGHFSRTGWTQAESRASLHKGR